MIDFKKSIDRDFKSFGINKKQEIARLCFEIAKREGVGYRELISDEHIRLHDYTSLKTYLIKRRFPYATAQNEKISVHLPKLDSGSGGPAHVRQRRFYPKKIYFEPGALHSGILSNIKAFFPQSTYSSIQSFKKHVSNKKVRKNSTHEYTNRTDTLYIIKEKFDFIKACPCTKNAHACGYSVLNLGFGCIFECTYCYLQGYSNVPGIVLPYNIDDFLEELGKSGKSGVIGTGEFTDSLALDDITGYSLPILAFLKKNPHVRFEFKTKSDTINNLLTVRPGKNVTVSWSLNPERIIKSNEHLTASLEARIAAADRCVRGGYRVGFHFDPIIHYSGWERDYQELLNKLFKAIKAEDIAWISLGTLRFNPGIKPVIEKRFPDNTILDEELLLGFDKKLRYPPGLRTEIYKKMISWIRPRAYKTRIYLCMEEDGIWQKLTTKGCL